MSGPTTTRIRRSGRCGRGGHETCAGDAGDGGEISDHRLNRSRPISDDPLVATYHLAAIAAARAGGSVSPARLAGPTARLAALDEILDDVDAMLTFRLWSFSRPSDDGLGNWFRGT